MSLTHVHGAQAWTASQALTCSLRGALWPSCAQCILTVKPPVNTKCRACREWTEAGAGAQRSLCRDCMRCRPHTLFALHTHPCRPVNLWAWRSQGRANALMDPKMRGCCGRTGPSCSGTRCPRREPPAWPPSHSWSDALAAHPSHITRPSGNAPGFCRTNWSRHGSNAVLQDPLRRV